MRCNNCGWENPNGNQTCEKCGAPLQGGASAQNLDVHSTIRESKPFEPQEPIDKTITEPAPAQPSQPRVAPTVNYGGTVNPWAMGGGGYSAVGHCKLTPIMFQGENPRFAPQEIAFKGDYNELNRENLDPDNSTITSKVQALLTHKDGKWYIQDKSSQKSTFVYAAEPTAIKTGDIILMGNRAFVFTEE